MSLFIQFVQIVGGLFVALLIWDYFNKKHRFEVLKKSNIPGKPCLPIIGTALHMRGLNAENMIDTVRTNLRMCGKISYSFVFNQLGIFDADPKDLEFLLSSPVHITKNNVYDMLSLWLGDGLLMSTGKKWHKRRKIITPTFHFKILEDFIDIFDQQSSTMVDKLKTYADGQTIVNIFPIVCLTALDIIGETAMGVQLNAQNQPDVPYVKAVKFVTNVISQRLRRPLWRLDWLFKLVAPGKYHQMMENIQIMQEFTKDVIEKRRKTLVQELAAAAKANDKNKRMVLLDVLLQATIDDRPLSNEDIREEVDTFMFEGHDTTTSGISFAIYMLSRHADVQQKVYEEIREVMGNDKNARITYEVLQNFKYLECVLKESMRLYPPVPIIGRYFKDDVEINNRTIPGNTHLYMPLFVILRDPDYFDDADAFKPERFFADNNKDIFPFAYVPFSAGPRNCIGQKYAMLEMKTTISKLLLHYEILPLGPDAVPSLSLIMRSKTGINIGLKPRL